MKKKNDFVVMFLFLLSWQRFNLTSSVEVETMEKIEIRAVIKFFFIKGLKGREIYGELESTLPSDYHLFKHLKNFIRGTRFSSNDEVSVAVNQWFRDQPKDFYLAGVRSLKNRWEKCNNLRGDYIEKL